jgi:PIN like domain
MKPAVVRFYFDADIQGVAKLLAQVRSDLTYPGDPGGVIHKRVRPACPVTDPAMDDDVWIPIVTAANQIIVTRDRKIREHRAEIAAIRDAGARMVVLSGGDAEGTWDQLEVIVRQWREIERLCDEPGPFIRLATRSGLTPLAL